MINDNIDFDYSISKILQGTNTDIYLQSNVLNSDYMNKSFEQIEKTLNTLYEKTRYLEDAILYTKEFLETKINYFNDEINSVLHEIENIADSSKDLAYISYDVPFINNTEIIADRDGRKLMPLTIKDNSYLVLSYSKDQNVIFNSCDRISDSIPYKDNLNIIKKSGQIIKTKDEAYRTVYLEDHLAPKGLTESIIMYFKEPVDINILDIELSNCKIKNLKFGLINGTEEYIGDYSIDMPKKQRRCIYIQFDLVCTNYEMIEYELDKALITDNIWSQIKEFEYNSASMLELSSKFDTSVVISKYNVTKDIKKPYGTATGETSKLILYSYIFGIDSFVIRNNEYYTDGYMISDPIYIGKLEDNEYIRLNVSHNKGDCSEISYSILDGDREIPIAILNEEFIEDELIFGEGIPARFEMDFDSGQSYTREIIKQNGAYVDISYIDAQKQALESSDNRFSVTYRSSTDFFNYKPINNTIRVKCYIRTMNKEVKNVPYISGITIRKYGEESLWTNRY